MATLKEKIGYGFGDMASSSFWKVFSYYLPVFYAKIFGLSLVDAGVLMLVTRVWDAVSDPMMGIIADRTHTRWGKYRPYLLWIAAPFSICGILLFTTPDWGYAAKLVWAYVTYILMMTIYTAINVPYGSMLGVMTDSPEEKTVFSSFRMFFAYTGSFISLLIWEPLCNAFGGYDTKQGWQWAMICVASGVFVLFILCFLLTKEHIHTVSKVSVAGDLKALVKNKPWWLMIGAALCSNLFNTVRGSAVAFFFADVLGTKYELTIPLLGVSFMLFAGLFLTVGEISNMAGVALAVPACDRLGKKRTFIVVNICLMVLSVAFFFIPISNGGVWTMLVLQVVISIFTGIQSPLVWSMYADVSDYAELKYRTASTGLIFSSASMAQKFGGAVGGAAVMWLLAACGYVADAEAGFVQPDSALTCLKMLMSLIPALVALLAVGFASLYPLTTARVDEISRQLKAIRAGGENS